MNIEDLTAGPHPERVWDLWHDLLATGHLSGEIALVCKDGSTRELDYRSVARILPGVHLSVGRDITERRKLRSERDASVERLRLQINRLPVAYIVLDAEGRVLEWNPAATTIFGYSREEAVGSRCVELIVPLPVSDDLRKIFDRVRAGDMHAHSTNENVTKDGRTLTCRWFNTPLIEPDGRFSGVLSLAEDVTERRRAQQCARRQPAALSRDLRECPRWDLACERRRALRRR